MLAFLESYGISALDDSVYASVILSRLGDLERRMAASGLHIATGSLVAPTQGGQSWFSHGTLLSGLWLDNQLKYDLLLTSDRETLVDDFRRAGYETVVLMPAITLAWPEGRWFGYDEIYAHRDIDYAGPPLNWVTMPDQFTWSFLERTVRVRAEGRPLFAEVGLISSHAPWTPISAGAGGLGRHRGRVCLRAVRERRRAARRTVEEPRPGPGTLCARPGLRASRDHGLR